jgi:hypothetical protein
VWVTLGWSTTGTSAAWPGLLVPAASMRAPNSIAVPHVL